MSGLFGSEPGRPISWLRRVATYAVVLLIGFALGFVPMWFKLRDSALSLSEASSRAGLVQTQNTAAAAGTARQLDLAVLQNTLGSAAIDAQRGDYEAARLAASSFFTSLREKANKGDDAGFTQAQKDGVEALFDRRDDTISLLARNDPAATERLSDLYVSFRELIASEVAYREG